MTSKVQKLKESQGYTRIPACCKTCGNFTSTAVETKYFGTSYFKEKNKRCSIGGFAVQSTGHCKLFERAEESKEVQKSCQ